VALLGRSQSIAVQMLVADPPQVLHGSPAIHLATTVQARGLLCQNNDDSEFDWVIGNS
jgi:hypothetical protein